jgi:PAS domain S-box-containing protein
LEFEQPEWLEQMAGILETLNEGVLIVDDCEHVIFVNSVFEEMTGVSREEVLGKDPLLVYYGPDEIAYIRERRREVQSLGRIRHEFFLPTKDGSKLPVVSSARNMEDPDGRTFTIISFTDISEQKSAEEQLRAANKLLEERQREIEEDLTLAARVQQSLAPKSLTWGSLEVYRSLESSRLRRLRPRHRLRARREPHLFRDDFALAQKHPSWRHADAAEPLRDEQSG